MGSKEHTAVRLAPLPLNKELKQPSTCYVDVCAYRTLRLPERSQLSGGITMTRLGRLRARGGWAWRRQTRGEGQCAEGEGPFLSELRARRVEEAPHLTSGDTEAERILSLP